MQERLMTGSLVAIRIWSWVAAWTTRGSGSLRQKSPSRNSTTF